MQLENNAIQPADDASINLQPGKCKRAAEEISSTIVQITSSDHDDYKEVLDHFGIAINTTVRITA